MPTYDYRCADCGHRFEIQQSFSDDALTVCPECSGVLKKVFSAPGVSFKGSGFYKTDSRSGSSTSSTSGSGDSSGSDGGSSSAASTGTGSGDSAGSAASTASTGSGSSTPAASTSGTGS